MLQIHRLTPLLLIFGLSCLATCSDAETSWSPRPEPLDPSSDVDCNDYYVQSFEEFFGLVNFSYADDPPNCTFPLEEFVEEDTKPSFLYSTASGPRSVLFYNASCPYSAEAKPPLIKFARNLTSTIATEYESNVTVKFYVVSCQAHSDLCDDQNIDAVPTLKLFRAGSVVAAAQSTTVLNYLRLSTRSPSVIQWYGQLIGRDGLTAELVFKFALDTALSELDINAKKPSSHNVRTRNLRHSGNKGLELTSTKTLS